MPEAEATDSGTVFRLIYGSRSQIPADDRTSELGAIFTTARVNNKRLGVTGALIVSDESFVQALEGEESVVRDLYAAIGADSRHNDVKLIEAGTVDGRTFGRWAMAKVAESGGPDIRLLSNTARGRIVEAGRSDQHTTSEQETVLGLMRGSL